MDIRRLPGARAMATVLWLVLIAGLALAIWLKYIGPVPRLEDMTRPQIDEKATLSLLRSEALAFLVTRRLTTQIVVERAESNWLGEWRGVLWATVHMHYGVDLQKLPPESICRKGETIVVTLPEPEVLSRSVEPGSVRLLSKSTAAAKLDDILHNGHRAKLERCLHDHAVEFAKDHDLMPSRAHIVQQLNAAAAALKGAAGVTIVFE